MFSPKNFKVKRSQKETDELLGFLDSYYPLYLKRKEQSSKSVLSGRTIGPTSGAFSQS